MTDSVGDIVDRRYLLRREIARTAVGIVFEAEHVVTGRAVALKRLHPSVLHDALLRQRLGREARLLTLARHPCFVEVLDAGEAPPGDPYMVMEMLDGRSLDGLLATRRVLPVELAARIGIGIAEALAVAHGHGIIHRDVKPSNVFLPREGSGGPPAKLIDFGVACIAEVTEGPAQIKLTRAGELLGTAEYMAPEQLRNEPVDARADLYALGVTLFEMLTGEVPVSGSYPEVLVKVSTSLEVPSPRRVKPDVPLAVDAVVVRALARSPADRFPDARSFAEALTEALAAVPAQRTQAQATQRRRFRRAPYLTPVRIVRADASTQDGRSEDISEGGMLVFAPALLSNDERVEVRFALPIEGLIVKIGATARWIVSARDGKGAVGLEFVDVKDEVRLAIGRYVELMAPPAD